ncbi:arginine--tRNA ligase [Cellulophaga baltica]|uniref:arginine--tRNA ligase n=1 Tax=Cellulophaga TaxID=104264 RepID=UPI001C065A1E|nr:MULTISPECIES: arginine--tRNA ligase [Cellulophaga]MBU2997028.1 arginine--tRNA ligase [Cellulophaga baltica]MDO6768426.1 arginine--tRNA ligase [Cellulophaga sp. 1_MG-2023]
MNIQNVLETKVKEAVSSLYQAELPTVEFQPTRKDFEGDITVVVFPMLRVVKGNPVQIGNQIGEYLVNEVEEVSSFNVIKGFLNLVVNDNFYVNYFNAIAKDDSFGFVKPDNSNAVMVEYSSPNTNKPLHLGHIRNNLLGYSVAEILKASGKKVYKTQIINDRGIHICKSMLAWQKFGEGETPESTGLKGDKLVGNYYVAFDKAYKAEIADLVAKGTDKEVAEKQAPILLEAQQMLLKWEAGDEKVVALWKKMNQWVYDGFEVTYKNLGVDFDNLYYESNTYLLGKDIVAEGLEKGIFFKKEDGSVWIDLTEDGLDEKIVLRSDGTAVYMTQDIGTAIQRVKDNPDVSGMVYTVGNEQDYHFKVLFLILKKLGFSWSENLFHLSYGMVDLPSGKMKSREGTVVDADDLMNDMTNTAGEISEELGKLDGYSSEEKQDLFKMIGLGALKYYILKVDPKKRILFNPEESVDFQGNTGPFIQYTYARIQSILRKAKELNLATVDGLVELHEKEKELIKQLQLFPETIQLAASNYSPALIANYTYDLVKEFNSFYQNVSILGEADDQKKAFRVQLSKKVSDVIQLSFKLLGIDVPERM